MENKQILGIVGVILLIAGLFLPLVKIAILGTVSFYENNQAEAIVIIALGVISIVFILAKKYSLLGFSSFAIVAVMSASGIQIARRILGARSKAEKLLGKIADKMTDVAIDRVHIQWGLGVLLLGLLLIIICTIIGSRRAKTPSAAK